MKKFHISDVLSVITGHLLSNGHMHGLYSISNYLTGKKLNCLELNFAMLAARRHILKIYPSLKSASKFNLIDGNIDLWLKNQIILHGEFVKIPPIPKVDNKIFKDIKKAYPSLSSKLVICLK